MEASQHRYIQSYITYVTATIASQKEAVLTTPRIAAIQGAPNRVIQGVMLRAARRWTHEGARVTGLVEVFEDEAASARHAVRLRNLRTGNEYRLFQDLGPMAAACHLDGAGIVSACASLHAEIASGCDLVVLSKFGQLEALRSGLNHAFAAAVEQDTPVLTAVSPTYQAAWAAFSAPLACWLPAEESALDQWWLGICSDRHGINGSLDGSAASLRQAEPAHPQGDVKRVFQSPLRRRIGPEPD